MSNNSKEEIKQSLRNFTIDNTENFSLKLPKNFHVQNMFPFLNDDDKEQFFNIERENFIEFLNNIRHIDDLKFEKFFEKIIHNYNTIIENIPVLQYKLTLPGAIPPSKNTINDAGFDLHLLKLIKQVNNVYLFDTGVSLIPPFGYYTEIIPRSSIYKTGYTLANNVGIIDSNYRGNIMVALLRDSKSIEPHELVGQKMVQVIIRKMYISQLEEINIITNTSRGNDGGINRD